MYMAEKNHASKMNQYFIQYTLGLKKISCHIFTKRITTM